MAVNRLLIDANNLIHALLDRHIDAGRSRLVEMIDEFVHLTGSEACIVFDGPAPRSDEASRISSNFESVIYSGRRTADAVIIDILNDYSAPRTIRLISSDRELVRAGKRRKAKTCKADDFADELIKTLKTAEFEPPAPTEPPEKTKGLSKDQLNDWLKFFDRRF